MFPFSQGPPLPSRITRLLTLFAAAAAIVLSPGTGAGRTWHVPGDALTIQDAIDLAQSGDDVLVSAGEYREREIELKGGVLVHSVGGAAVTTVNALDAGAAFDVRDLTSAASLDGFTIVNGHAQYGSEVEMSGGGIRCVNSRLLIENCVVSGCRAEILGGGIYAQGSNVEIDRCVVTGCYGYGDGGGVYASRSSVAIRDGVMSGNRSPGIGAIWASGPCVTMERCVVEGNSGTFDLSIGGIGCSSPSLEIRDCLVTHNYCGTYPVATALAVYGSAGSISGCTIANNTAVGEPVTCIYLEESPVLQVEGVIAAFNDGVAFACDYSQSQFRCCDVYGNPGGNAVCGQDLGGNFSADPLFCDAAQGDYSLDGSSPCLPGHDHGGVDCGLVGARGQGCGVITGACCFPDGSCHALAQADCATQHGTYQGDGTTCTPNPCHPTPVQVTTWGRVKAVFR